MSGNEFLDLATQLLASTNEARLRTATSRAYYAAYHAARNLIVACGVEVPWTNIHDKVQWCLQETSSSLLKSAGGRLGSLRSERNRADYNLDDSKFQKAKNSQLQVRVAVEIVTAIESVAGTSGMTQIREEIRDYAQGVLHWHLI